MTWSVRMEMTSMRPRLVSLLDLLGMPFLDWLLI